MKALVYEQFQRLPQLQTVPDPKPVPDGVVIRVEASGLCRSDWHGWMGHDDDIVLPHVPGHEFAGVIEAVGDEVKHWYVGDRVTIPFAVGCGHCDQCRAGHTHICDADWQPGFMGWGSFAEYVAIPRADVNLVRLPHDLDMVTAASLGCRFTTAYRAVVMQGNPTPGEWVAVYGCGGVGLSAVMIAHSIGARVVAIDISEEALKLAKTLGADAVVNAKSTDTVGAVRDITGGGADVALDALGSIATCRNALMSLKKRGRHVQVGLLLAEHAEVALPLNIIIGGELIIVGSHGMPAHDYSAMLAQIERGLLTPQQLVTDTIKLSEAPERLAAMGDFKGTGMTVIDRFSS